MKILVAGKFDPAYNRTKIILDGLLAQPGVSLSFYNYKEKNKLHLPALRKACQQADVIFLPSFTHLNVPLIKWLSGKPVIFDPLISRYLTKVFDYKQVSKYSPRALKNFLKDKISMSMADLVLCDTQAHLQYFHKTIGIPLNKLQILPVGVNTDDFKPSPGQRNNNVFIAGFYGGFIPLQGTKMIVETANYLRKHTDIHFRLIGNGFEYNTMKKLADDYQLTNISFPGWVDYNKLAEEVNAFDLCLGIFGETQKADVVIPNKIFHYASLKKAIITKDTPAIREIFEDGSDILLSENNAAAIAEKILLLKNDPALRTKIAANCYEKITTSYNHLAIGKKFLAMATKLLSS
ncbi:Glycosyltransferase involved in cell wall bisynthesis [Chitinophaga sp. CF118]|uniref:glycosyltransferase n=1 Tax=Chitinophaga sp. CF118 TaxID=1884367 RepID=UPI0008E10C0D|nr:glycosyltransferase [Chitinophaga sp. CF118]SFD11402.1 Glycosyltransferase involved in cell wall bisynthesis [Chitinophaga sp. CF118]